MTLEPHDLHLVFSEGAETLEVWNAKHVPVLKAEAHNRTVNDGFAHWGHCPLGEFLLGDPVTKRTVPFGPWFIPVEDYQGQHKMRNFGREGIGIHGGGSGLADPFAPRQGWVPTEGCIRLQNQDLEGLVALVIVAQKAGGKCYLSVVA